MTNEESLSWAIKNGDSDAVKTLLNQVNMLAVDTKPRTVGAMPKASLADKASGSQIDQDMKPHLVKSSFNGRTALCMAADYGQDEMIKILLDKGADINEADKHGITPLLSAIYEGHKECVKLLLEKGANKMGKSPNGDCYADCTDDKDVQEMLKD